MRLPHIDRDGRRRLLPLRVGREVPAIIRLTPARRDATLIHAEHGIIHNIAVEQMLPEQLMHSSPQLSLGIRATGGGAFALIGNLVPPPDPELLILMMSRAPQEVRIAIPFSPGIMPAQHWDTLKWVARPGCPVTIVMSSWRTNLVTSLWHHRMSGALAGAFQSAIQRSETSPRPMRPADIMALFQASVANWTDDASSGCDIWEANVAATRSVEDR